MSSRRDFIKQAALLSGAAGAASILPSSIQRALAINPDAGSTFMDAEHVVILMQENRSFDHCYGSLKGVRGFNDPRAIVLPDKKPVWLQTNEQGQTFAPFRLDIKNTKATWMGSLPHSWTNQTDARNNGLMDKWLEVKKSGDKDFADMPLTMGYYTRKDLPFYYSMADAFTVCDQNFCSSLTGTTPNRLYFWSGTIREKPDENVQACVNNEDADYRKMVNWKTFPERLEENGVSWKIYQNEISAGVGFTSAEDRWLASFEDNPLEFFAQYQVQYVPAYYNYLPRKIVLTREKIASLELELKNNPVDKDKLLKSIESEKKSLLRSQAEEKKYSKESFQRLSETEKNIHQKAFTTNASDPDYHRLESYSWTEDGTMRSMNIPKGDVLFQFREDVKKKTLPTVSWLVPPENLSDHPSAPWYGAAYISETLDILTSDPEVWKKTIFILAYDENDGYFDHVPPFTAPHPDKPEEGRASKGIDTRIDYVKKEQDAKWKPLDATRDSPVGLGFRVPLIVASPWTRGGTVNSQVFDHTSTLQFLEKFLSAKKMKKIEETNISSWRRAVCGDLTSVFKPYNGEKLDLPAFIKKEVFYGQVYDAQFKKNPGEFDALTKEQIQKFSDVDGMSSIMTQETGVKISCALPYQIYADGNVAQKSKSLELKLIASNELFGKKAAGVPFNVYALGLKTKVNSSDIKAYSYAVAAGAELVESWHFDQFVDGLYHLKVYGPNGFYREFNGDASDPLVSMELKYEKTGNVLTGNVIVDVTNHATSSLNLTIADKSYKKPDIRIQLPAGRNIPIPVNLASSANWYDLQVTIDGGGHFQKRFAGRIETGKDSTSDPAMGRTLV